MIIWISFKPHFAGCVNSATRAHATPFIVRQFIKQPVLLSAITIFIDRWRIPGTGKAGTVCHRKSAYRAGRSMHRYSWRFSSYEIKFSWATSRAAKA